MVLYEIGESNESVSLPSKSSVVFVVVIILAMFIYDGYHSFQGADRESKAHTTVENA